MPQIDQTIFNLPISEADLYTLVNTMGLTYLQFAHATHYYNRMYGVLTDKNEGLTERYGDATRLRSLIVNNCVRDALYRLLLTVQDSTELYLGYNITSRYHYEERPFPVRGRWQTQWPGIIAMNVRPEWTSIEELEEVLISPYMELNVTVNPGPPVVVPFDRNLSPNPRNVFFRKQTTHAAYTPDDTINPVRNGSDWEVTLGTNQTGWTPGDDVSIQYKDEVSVVITNPTLPAGATLHPVYPGTTQIIPYSRPPQVVSPTQTRYFFYNYELVDPAFYLDEPVADFVSGEFYKLLPSIQFKYVRDVTVPFEVVWGLDTEETVFTVPDDEAEVNVLFANNGIVQTERAENILTWERFCQMFPTCPCTQGWPVESIKIRYYYKTDPNYLDQEYLYQIPSVREAMLYRTAAELPMNDCGCAVEDGFIMEQQKMVDSVVINKVLGIEEHTIRYGNLLGQQRYEALMKSALRFEKSVKVST